MRKKWQKQMTFMPQEIDHPQARELEAISQLLDSKSTIYEIVLQDLPSQAISGSPRGARGMTAEQVIRAAIVKVLFGFTYEELAFHLIDSMSIRRFCRIGIADEGFKKSTLHKNIKALSADTWQMINKEMLAHAGEAGIEKGRQVRIDCTVVESNIHKPSDSVLLWDGVRAITRLLERAQQETGKQGLLFHDHRRVAKKRMLAIQYARTAKSRKPLYKDLVKKPDSASPMPGQP